MLCLLSSSVCEHRGGDTIIGKLKFSTVDKPSSNNCFVYLLLYCCFLYLYSVLLLVCTCGGVHLHSQPSVQPLTFDKN